MPPTLGIWISALRPKTLWAAVAPIVMASAMCHEAGLFHAPSFVVILLAALLIQIGTNLANDYFDFRKGSDTEDRIGPTRVSQAGLVRPEFVRSAFILVFLLAIILGSYLLVRGGWPILVIGLSSVLLGVLYTGGPRPLAYVGLGDVFAFLYFGPVAVAGTWYVQAVSWNPATLLVGAAAGFFSAALLTVNNFRDIEADRQAGKKTLAVRLGPGFARAEFLFCLGAAAIIPFLLVGLFAAPWWVLMASLPVVFRFPGFHKLMRQEPGASREFGNSMNILLGEVGKLEMQYALLFSVGWLVHWPGG
ncbi:MAG: 1,4-dihydroxy-2-naphthoate polyprenyltransferase [Gemmatimonadales bacterium]|nr:1,4-dihydroxy-2-naphthoate polyprenyltransferase [Gemmatimonadales bacterium]